MFRYKGFGLIINSEIHIPELMLHKEDMHLPIDLFINIGETPKALIGTGFVRKVKNWAGNNEFLLEIPNLVRYHTFSGNTIIIQPLVIETVDWQSIRIFLLGTVMASILHQKKYIPLHASAIEYEQELILFCGKSGVGKSTTASFLKKRGYTLFSDDICVIKPKEIQDGIVYAHPTYPMIRLWADTIGQLEDKKIVAEERVRPDIAKFKNYFREDFDNQALPIRKIVVLGINDTEYFEKSVIASVPEKMLHLRTHTFRSGILKRMQGQTNLFHSLTTIASLIPVVKISRPDNYSNINDYIDFIENGLLRTQSIKEI